MHVCVGIVSLLSDDGQTIAYRHNDFLHTVVAGNEVVETADAEGLTVFVVGWIDDMPVPQGVVGKDDATLI